MATATTEWTVERVRSLPDDGNRYEIVDGKLLVTPSPSWTHQEAVAALLLRIAGYLKAHPVGHVIIAPADIEYDERTMVEPDLFVVPLVGGRRPRTWPEAGRLMLAVEVLSASSARADRIVKRRLYQRQGVPEYWIVDVDARAVERWRPEDDRPEILGEQFDWQPDPAHPAFTFDLVEYFAEVMDG